MDMNQVEKELQEIRHKIEIGAAEHKVDHGALGEKLAYLEHVLQDMEKEHKREHAELRKTAEDTNSQLTKMVSVAMAIIGLIVFSDQLVTFLN